MVCKRLNSKDFSKRCFCSHLMDHPPHCKISSPQPCLWQHNFVVSAVYTMPMVPLPWGATSMTSGCFVLTDVGQSDEAIRAPVRALVSHAMVWRPCYGAGAVGEIVSRHAYWLMLIPMEAMASAFLDFFLCDCRDGVSSSLEERTEKR